MLTSEEQAEILKLAGNLSRVSQSLRLQCRSGTISEKSRREGVARAREKLADHLKEVG